MVTEREKGKPNERPNGKRHCETCEHSGFQHPGGGRCARCSCSGWR